MLHRTSFLQEPVSQNLYGHLAKNTRNEFFIWRLWLGYHHPAVLMCLKIVDPSGNIFP